MSKKKVKSPIQTMANLKQVVKIGDKEYKIQSPSLGVASLLAHEFKDLLELAEFDFEKLDKEKTTAEELVTYVFKRLYNLIFSKKSDEAVTIIARVIALLINNKPLTDDNLQITPEQIKWDMKITDFFPVLLEVIKLGDMTDFFMMILRLVQMHDVEGVLKTEKENDTTNN